MPIPPFVAALRSKVGTEPLWRSGVTAVVTDAQGRILLTHRTDTHRWADVCGILEPGEAPAVAIVGTRRRRVPRCRVVLPCPPPEGTGHQCEERLADLRAHLADPAAGTRFDQPG